MSDELHPDAMDSSKHPPGSAEDAALQRSLDDLLHRTLHQLRRESFIEFILGLCAVALAALSLGAWFGVLVASDRWGALSTLFVICLGSLLVLLLVARRVFQHARGPISVARWLDQQVSSSGTVTLLDAAELQDELGSPGASDQLRRKAIVEATQFVHTQDLLELTTAKSAKRALRYLQGLASLAIAVFLTFLWAPNTSWSIIRALSSVQDLESAIIPPPPEPRLGEMTISYRYPEYTQIPPREVLSADGNIRALPGTEITIETRSRSRLRSGVAILTFGDQRTKAQDERRIEIYVSEYSLQVQFVVSRSGRYRFELVDEGGTVLVERSGHEISLETDHPPEVALLTPATSPLEVNRKDRIKIQFRADDDFALGNSQIVWRVLGTPKEGHQELRVGTRGKNHFFGITRFDLGLLPLQPGDRVAYTLEVFDNDVITGPKVGASETKELHIYSKRTRHTKVIQLELEALDAVVNLLGDNLETPFGKPKTTQTITSHLKALHKIELRAHEAISRLSKASSEARSDPLGRPSVGDAFAQAAREIQRRTGVLQRSSRSLKRNQRRERRSALVLTVHRQQEKLVDTLERQSVYLSDLIDDQRMLDAESLTNALRAQQQTLRQALTEYKTAPTEDKRRQIAFAIQDIQKRIQEIMSELARIRTEIPQDFVNTDEAFGRLPDLQDLQAQIEEGNLDEALQTLDRMLNQTERMLSQIQEGRQELQTREYSEITQRAEKLWRELEELRERQRGLTKQTEYIASELRKRTQDRLGDAQKFIQSHIEKLEQAKKILHKVRPERHLPNFELFELTKRRITDGKDALGAQDFGSAQEVLRQALQQMSELSYEARRRTDQIAQFGDVFGIGDSAAKTLEALSEAQPLVEGVLEAIDKLTPHPNELLSEDERQQLNRFEMEQEALSKMAKNLQQGLEELGEQLPIVGPEVRSTMADAQSAMDKSGQQLSEGNAPGAASQERKAVEALDQLSQQLQEMGDQSGGGQGVGVPLPFGQPRGNDREDERGGQGQFNRDRVEIPKPEQYQAPSEFRKDLLDAAKQGTVKSYREAVRRYYQELVK
ncbi:MAG: DUF4175 domain-containing protein [Myxococcales bacterium]|nr:DUF4175 domain-containing protein [Myxococcales bacterium]